LRTSGIIFTVIEIIFDVIAILLAVRILLRFFGANSSNMLVAWLYDTTGQLTAPFAGIFPNAHVSGFFVVDIAAIIALIVYSFIGYVLLNFVSDMRYKASEREVVVHKHRR
jgi:uncharacterized protein YggT (Ycf19 family)